MKMAEQRNRSGMAREAARYYWSAGTDEGERTYVGMVSIIKRAVALHRHDPLIDGVLCTPVGERMPDSFVAGWGPSGFIGRTP